MKYVTTIFFCLVSTVLYADIKVKESASSVPSTHLGQPLDTERITQKISGQKIGSKPYGKKIGQAPKGVKLTQSAQTHKISEPIQGERISKSITGRPRLINTPQTEEEKALAQKIQKMRKKRANKGAAFRRNEAARKAYLKSLRDLRKQAFNIAR